MEKSHDELLIEAILASGVKIPPIPEVLLKLQAVLADDAAGPRELAEVVQHDGAISGALFRLTGSPVFGLRVKATNVEQAVSIMGMRTAAATARGTALRGALHDPQHAAVLEALWTRSGTLADLMLRAVKCAPLRGLPADLAYTLGMFHDCGIALLIKRFPDYAQTLTSPAGWENIPQVDLRCGVHHVVSGQMVARSWLLPDDVIQAIRHHHDLNALDLSPTATKLVALLQFACHLLAVQQQHSDGEWQLGWRDECQRRLGLDDAQMEGWENELQPRSA